MTAVLDAPAAIALPSSRQSWWLLGIGSAVVVGGLLLDSTALILVALAAVGVAALHRAVTAPASFVLMFIAVRPLLDLGPTYRLGPDVNSPAGALLLIALAAWAAQHRERLTRPSRSVMAAGVFAIAAVASVPGSFDATQSSLMALRVLSIVALFAFAEQLQRLDPASFWRIAAAVVASAVGAAVIAALQTFDLVALPPSAVRSLDLDLERPAGPYPAAPVFATHLFIALVVVLLSARQALAARRTDIVVHLGFLGAFMGWLMVENRSRSPLLALGIAMAVGSLLLDRWRGLAACLLVALAAVALINPTTVRADEIGSGSTPGAENDTLAWRVSYWEQNLPRIYDSPITGIGLGRVEQLNDSGNPPHSTVVQAIVEMGAFGVAAYVGVVATLAADLIRRLRRARTETDRLIVVATLSLCLGYACIGLFENLLTQVVTSGPVALLTGAALAHGFDR